MQVVLGLIGLATRYCIKLAALMLVRHGWTCSTPLHSVRPATLLHIRLAWTCNVPHCIGLNKLLLDGSDLLVFAACLHWARRASHLTIRLGSAGNIPLNRTTVATLLCLSPHFSLHRTRLAALLRIILPREPPGRTVLVLGSNPGKSPLAWNGSCTSPRSCCGSASGPAQSIRRRGRPPCLVGVPSCKGGVCIMVPNP